MSARPVGVGLAEAGGGQGLDAAILIENVFVDFQEVPTIASGDHRVDGGKAHEHLDSCIQRDEFGSQAKRVVHVVD